MKIRYLHEKKEALGKAEVFERAKVLLDAEYITIKGALFVILLGLKELGIKQLNPKEVIEILGISRASFYRVKREIEEQEGWTLSGRGIMLWLHEEEGGRP